MRICFFASDKPREHQLADAFLMGARKHGHSTEVRPLSEDMSMSGFDVACMVGVKSRALRDQVRAVGAIWLIFDKGYCRQKRRDGMAGWEYWRVSINEHHPTARLSRPGADPQRWRALGLDLKPYRAAGDQIVIAGSSAKYHEFYGLREPTTYASKIVQDLRKDILKTDRPIVYRPKPSWREAVPVQKTRFSTPSESIGDALAGAWALVTHGSNACFEAMLMGVPCIVLGNAVARPISSTELAAIEEPRVATGAERLNLLANLAWWQWTAEEMANGAAWAFIGSQLHVQP
jgi:hypothetical protein